MAEKKIKGRYFLLSPPLDFSCSSQSNIKVDCGGITGGDPRTPYPYSGGIVNIARSPYCIDIIPFKVSHSIVVRDL